MQVFFHHVGSKGSADFDKTVFKTIPMSIVEAAAPPDSRDALVSDLSRQFPSGGFNCWGVPEGAKSVVRTLAAGDFMLLVRGLNVDDSVPALCPVRLFWNLKMPALSEVLWGDIKYPYIFFFDTERLTYSWPEMVQDLSYKPNWNPAGMVNRVTPDRMTPYGGAAGYVGHVRTEYGLGSDPFASVSQADADAEPELQFGGADAASVDAALQQLRQEVVAAGNDPSLTHPAATVPHSALVRDAAFGVGVKRIYGFRCAACGVGARGPKQQTELDAAHIFPKRKLGSDDLRNGLCLCKRHHWAFDVGWFVVKDDYTIEVRPDLPPDPDYTFIAALNGQKIDLPSDKEFWPHPKFLAAQRALTVDAAARTVGQSSPTEPVSVTGIGVPVAGVA